MAKAKNNIHRLASTRFILLSCLQNYFLNYSKFNFFKSPVNDSLSVWCCVPTVFRRHEGVQGRRRQAAPLSTVAQLLPLHELDVPVLPARFRRTRGSAAAVRISQVGAELDTVLGEPRRGQLLVHPPEHDVHDGENGPFFRSSGIKTITILYIDRKRHKHISCWRNVYILVHWKTWWKLIFRWFAGDSTSIDEAKRQQTCQAIDLSYIYLYSYISMIRWSIQPTLGVDLPNHVTYFFILSPVQSYFGPKFAAVNLLADARYVRSVRGGVGDCKLSANYAPSLRVQVRWFVWHDRAIQRRRYLYSETRIGSWLAQLFFHLHIYSLSSITSIYHSYSLRS